MPEHSENAAANIVDSIVDAIADNLPKQKSVRFEDGSISDQAKRLFGGQKSVHHVLGGGKCTQNLPDWCSDILCKEPIHNTYTAIFDIYDLYLLAITAADVLLWRNKKISSSVLAVATAVWVFFEWLDYHFLTIACFVLVLGMVVQFAWSTFAGMLNGYETWKKFSASCVVRESL